MKNKKELFISKRTNIQSALQQMDKTGARLLLVMDDNKFVSVISIGDIQRAIIANHDLDEPITNILRSKVNFASPYGNREKKSFPYFLTYYH